MKPYRRSILMPPEQKFFNTVLSSSRTCIEQAFGGLKGRFKRLKGIESTDITLVSKTTVACCILHNLCVKQGKILYVLSAWLVNHGFFRGGY